MKLIIDIDDDIRFAISQMGLLRISDEMQKKVDKAIQHGTPIPDNATNGDVITEILKSSNDMHSTRYIGLAQEDTIYIEVGSNWWNSPYQKGGKQ